jgi:hypothetical protein
MDQFFYQTEFNIVSMSENFIFFYVFNADVVFFMHI